MVVLEGWCNRGGLQGLGVVDLLVVMILPLGLACFKGWLMGLHVVVEWRCIQVEVVLQWWSYFPVALDGT
jgi:hypothetical protein